MKDLIIMIVLLSNMTLLMGQEQKEGIRFMDNPAWKEVLKQAQEQNKLIFVDCYTVWCGPCKALAKEIFPQKIVGDFFNSHFISVKYDMEKGDGKMLRKQYKEYIPGFPSLLLMNAEGEVVQQMVGYHSAEELIAGMKAGLEGNSIFVLQERYESGARDFETIRDYVSALYGAFQRGKIKPVVMEYLKTIPMERLLEPAIWDLVGKHISDPYSEAYQYVLTKIEKLQYQTKVNRYALERQLNYGMKSAIKELMTKTIKMSKMDSLELVKKQIKELQRVLKLNVIDGFSQWLCELEILYCCINQDVNTMYDYLQFGNRIHLFDRESDFVVYCYQYIVTESKNKKLLREILGILIDMQTEMDKSDVKLLNYNYYDVIALTYERLGQKEKAEEARSNHERIEKERKSEVEAIFGSKK